MDLLDLLKEKKRELIEKKENKKRRQKEVLIKSLLEDWSEEEVKSYNRMIRLTANGLNYRFYSEREIKLINLNLNIGMFTEEEYSVYYDMFKPLDGSIKRKKKGFKTEKR